MKIRCECALEGVLKEEMKNEYNEEKELPFVNHKINECKCTNNLKQYLRDNRKVWLCSNCNLPSDILLNQ